MGGRPTKIFARAYRCGPESRPDEIKRRLSERNPGFLVQVTKAGRSQNEVFLEMLAAQTLYAETTGSLLAKKPEIDFLLRMAGTTQISAAIKEAGARRGESFVVLAAGQSEVGSIPELAGRELPRRDLSRKELVRIERAALLNARRP